MSAQLEERLRRAREGLRYWIRRTQAAEQEVARLREENAKLRREAPERRP